MLITGIIKFFIGLVGVVTCLILFVLSVFKRTRKNKLKLAIITLFSTAGLILIITVIEFQVYPVNPKSDLSSEFQTKLQSLLEKHLDNPNTINLVIEIPSTGTTLQFVQFADPQARNLTISGHPEINDLKENFDSIEKLLKKHGLEHYYGSTKNYIYIDYTDDQLRQLIDFSNDFFLADYVNAELSELEYSFGYRKDGRTYYSDTYNLLKQ